MAEAIEDGATLTACLKAVGDPAAALERYERLRLRRVTRLQEMSRANKLRFHMRDGPMQVARDAGWRKSPDRNLETMRWLYGFDARALVCPKTRSDQGTC